MIRWLELFDRVRELGDVFVLFFFDVYVMLYSEDVLVLEKELYWRFDRELVNKVNFRKEFFKVILVEIK